MKRTSWILAALLAVSSLSLSQPAVTYQAGTTWYDQQYRAGGTRMIDNDADGWVHVAWTNGMDMSNGNRHAFYNVWDPGMESFLYDSVGTQIDASMRSGFPTLAVNYDGRCYPAFHQQTGVEYYPAIGIDFLPRSGAFISCENNHISELSMLWPRIALDSAEQVVHIIAAENIDYGHYALYYARGIPHYDEFGFGESIEYQQPWQFIDSLAVLAYDITVSQNPSIPHVAITWAKSRNRLMNRRDNDLVYIESNNGGVTFSDVVNITHFAEPDWECLSGDTMACNRDTFRVHADISTIFDESDNLHVVFSTTNYYALQNRMARYAGQLWHWSEQNASATPIRAVGEDYTTQNWALDIGDDELVLQDPCLTLDRTAGDLFCTYSFCDTNQWSAIGIPQGDIWVSRSTDNGLTWSVGMNITNTNGGQGASIGECLDESYPSAARFIRHRNNEAYLDITYMLDLDAGPSGLSDFTTLNPIRYLQAQVDSIPIEPIWNPSWPRLHADTTATISTHNESIINLLSLAQNYPNPFNATTTIHYDLPQTSTVTLTIFNLIGQKVAQPVSDARQSAGSHSIEFDASRLSTGIYFYQLNTGNNSQTQKMMLLK